MQRLQDPPRFFAPTWNVGDVVELNDEELKHAKVLRLESGDEVHLMNGRGRLANAKIINVKPRLSLEVDDLITEQKQSGNLTILAVAPTKNINRFEWVIEKATEVGIDQIIPILCEHSERKVVKRDRLERLVLSAAKQSKALWMPEVSELFNFKDVLEVDADNRWIAHCHSINKEASLRSLSSRDGKTLILIGPEGDFSSDEVEAALNAGFEGLDLGKKRLRTETAAIVAVLSSTLLRDEIL